MDPFWNGGQANQLAKPRSTSLGLPYNVGFLDNRNERNARVFHRKSAPPPVLLRTIIDDAKLWVLAGAKKLGSIIVHE